MSGVKHGADVSEWSSKLKARHAKTLLARATKKNTSKFLPPIHFAKCVSVYDGDTITVAAPLYPGVTAQFSLRMHGYDSPEMRSRNHGEKRIALIARDKMSELVRGALLRVELQGIGKYGRPLAIVHVQSYDDGRPPLEISLNDWMLQHRLAVPYDGGKKRKVNWPLYYEDNKLRGRKLMRLVTKKDMESVARSVF